MLREMILAEWERRRVPFLLLAALFLAIPLRYAAALSGGMSERELWEAARLGRTILLPALVVGAAMWGSGVWAPERRGRWVHFLSLPAGRARLFALRYAAGLAWLAAAVGALAAASYALATAAALPPMVFAYPGPFVAGAALAAWLGYTAGFAAGARWTHPERAAGVALLALFLAAVAVQRLTDYRLTDDWPLDTLVPFGLVFETPFLLGS